MHIHCTCVHFIIVFFKAFMFTCITSNYYIISWLNLNCVYLSCHDCVEMFWYIYCNSVRPFPTQSEYTFSNNVNSRATCNEISLLWVIYIVIPSTCIRGRDIVIGALVRVSFLIASELLIVLSSGSLSFSSVLFDNGVLQVFFYLSKLKYLDCWLFESFVICSRHLALTRHFFNLHDNRFFNWSFGEHVLRAMHYLF